MKATINLDGDLWRRARRAAIDRGCTVGEIIERGLRRELAVGGGKIQWVTASGHLPAGLDVSNRDAIWEWIAADGV